MRSLSTCLVALSIFACAKKGGSADSKADPKSVHDAAMAQPEAPAATLSNDDCKAILADALAAAKPEGPPRPATTATGTKISAEALAVRGAGSAVCVSWREQATCSEELEDGACPDEAGGADTMYLVAVVDPSTRAITDKSQHSATRSMTDSTGVLSWAVVPIAAAKDALVLSAADESGDTSVSEVSWHTVTGGKLTDQLSYKHGSADGEEIGTVEHKVLTDVVNGHFAIQFDIEKDGETSSDTCTWDAGESAYKCKKDLLEKLSD